jgi:hypothetical protein
MNIVVGSETLGNYLHNWTISSHLHEYGASKTSTCSNPRSPLARFWQDLARGSIPGVVVWVIIKDRLYEPREVGATSLSAI